MGKKGPMPTFATVDEYIASQPEAAQKILKELRALIKEAVPEATEVFNAKVPTFTLTEGGKSGLHLMMAAYARFVSFYPFPSTLEAFSGELNEFKLGKGSVQFPFDKPLPRDLIIRMVKYRKNELRNEE